MQFKFGRLEQDNGAGSPGMAQDVVAAFKNYGVYIECGNLVKDKAAVDVGQLKSDDAGLVKFGDQGFHGGVQALAFEVDGHHVVSDITNLVAGSIHHVEDALKQLLFVGWQGRGVEDLDTEFGCGEQAAQIIVQFAGNAFSFEVLSFEMSVKDFLVLSFQLSVLSPDLSVVISQDECSGRKQACEDDQKIPRLVVEALLLFKLLPVGFCLKRSEIVFMLDLGDLRPFLSFVQAVVEIDPGAIVDKFGGYFVVQ